MELKIDLNDLPPIFWKTPIADIGYPRRTMPALHVSGCNLRCPYCLNHQMIKGRGKGNLSARGLVSELFMSGEEWVMVSGGEVLFNKQTPNLLALIKSFGMNVCLATNGTWPDRLKACIDEGLINHVVMDIKSSLTPEKYSKVTGHEGVDRYLARVIESAEILKSSPTVTCEFRTTMCSKYVDKQDIIDIAKFIGPDGVYCLQYYTIHQTLLPELADKKYIIPYEDLRAWAKEIEEYVYKVFVCEV